MSHFQPEPYRSEGGFSLVGLPILFGILLAAGIALGWVASWIGQWFYLILLFPLGMGLILIFVGSFTAHLTWLRNIPLATLAGIFAAAVTLASMHYFDHRRFVDLIADKGIPVPPEFNLLSFMKMQATKGVSIGKGDGLNLGYVGSWIYWSLEFLAVAVMATLGMIAGASEPFCTACEKWKESRTLGRMRRRGVNVAAYVSEGAIDRLAEHEPAVAGGDLELTVWVCPQCKEHASVVVKLVETRKNAKGEDETKELAHVSYPGEALAEFEALFGASGRDEKREARKEDDY